MPDLLRKHTIYGIPLQYYLPLCVLVLGSMAIGAVPGNLTGTLLILMVLGGLLNFIGGHLPFVRSFLGGGTFFCIFGAAAMAELHLFPADTLQSIDRLLNQTGFLDFFIAALITGSILSMDRSLLIRSAVRFLPVAFFAMGAGIGAVALAGMLLGRSLENTILFLAIPMMSGGMGAGVIPLSGIYAQAMGTDSSAMISRLIPASTLGNISAILMAALLYQLGCRFPRLSGNGSLMRDGRREETENKNGAPDPAILGLGLLLSLVFYACGSLLNHFFPVIHGYAWMIVLTGVFKASGLVSPKMAEASGAWSSFVIRTWTSAVLIGIGAALIDLQAVATALTPSYLFLILVVTAAVTFGAGLGGYLVDFYPIESAITAGLCTINMGGSGNIAILSASRRMELLAFAQLATRICGSLILVLASLLLKIWY